MTIELRPLGVACNLKCLYCYQQPQRDAGNNRTSYDLQKLKQEAARLGGPFTLFGGEPLLMPYRDLEDLFSWGKEKFGGSTIQTNGVLIEDSHINLFTQYNVQVGVSIDGPAELNNVRRAGSIEKTLEVTSKIEIAIEKLCAAGKTPGLIVTLHQGNSTPQHLPQMLEWFGKLDALGIKSVRLHLLEIDDESLRGSLSLTPQQNIHALLTFAEAEKTLKNIRFDTFRDMEKLLIGNDSSVSCVWRACDSYNTKAVQGIEGNGQSSNCGRTNKDGVDFIKAESTGFERYIALYHTPQSDYGCSGCRFFLMCKGQCPGTAVGGDWRNRTENCDEWKSLFGLMEKKIVLSGKIPLTLNPVRIKLEQLQLEAWKENKNPSIQTLLNSLGNNPSKESISSLNADQDQPSNPIPRVSWVSMEAQVLWEPRLARICMMLEESALQVGRARTGLCSVRLIPHTSYEALARRASELGISTAFLPSTLLPGAIASRPWEGKSSLLITGANDDVSAAISAFSTGDINSLLKRLDLPSCCLNHAMQAASKATSHQDIIALAKGKSGIAIVEEGIRFHPLLLDMGLSVLPIVPCSFSCQNAANSVEAILQLAHDAGMEEEVGWIRECLAWPLSWSSLHGIIEIKTPLFKLSVPSVGLLANTKILRKSNEKVPLGALGLNFPYAKTRF